jgi:tetratricopeptide (TPR) repeat protein
MEIEILRGELERLFTLEELLQLSGKLLGLDPEQVGGTSASASFAQALVESCLENECLDALADSIVAIRTEVHPSIREATIHGIPRMEELANDSQLGEFSIVKKIGEGPLAMVYQGRSEQGDVVLRVLRSEVAMDRRRVQRYLAQARLIFDIGSEGIPQGGFARWIDGRAVIGYTYFEAISLAHRVGRTGPMHLNEARPILKGVLEALSGLHQKRLIHGNLKLENILLVRDGSAQRSVLVDGGIDRLRRRVRSAGDVLGMVVTPKIAAPEQHRGKSADTRSDVYAFGVLLYEVLSGKLPFMAASPVEIANLHLSVEPEPPSAVAPRGWVSKELDDFVLSLLKKEPSQRPQDARVVMESLETLGRKSSTANSTKIEDSVVEDRIDALVACPDDDDAALALEAAVEEGAEPRRIAEAFAMAADQIDLEQPDGKESKKALLFRAARLFESSVKDHEKAEQMYIWLVELDPQDDIAVIALEEIRRHLGKYEELIEMLLARCDNEESSSERARAMAEIGRLYAHELDDRGEALVAFTQALVEQPSNDEYAAEVERLAGTDSEHWNEVLDVVAQATSDDVTSETRNALLLRLGSWYGAKASRPDLALGCYQAVVAAEPANDAALSGMANIYRTAQQWPELGAVLLRQADIAAIPAKTRDLRSMAAELLDNKLNEPLRAKDIYEQILAEDPAHQKACDALASIYERTGDYQSLVKILEQRAEALRGTKRAQVMCQIAELYEGQLDNLNEAIRLFEAAVAADDKYLDAIKGMDRVFNRTGRYKELLTVLDRQFHLAATPRQKINLLERIASIHDEEFLDHEKAAISFEEILKIDPAHESSLMSLVRHYRALDRWEQVAELYDRHLKVNTDNQRRVDLLVSKARVLSEQVGSPERAMHAYEQVLEISPDHGGALEALARLRETAGDANAALDAIEALAEKAATPEAKAEQWLRAAKLLEARGDRDGAIERYKAALDVDPQNKSATSALRGAYAARGDAASAVGLIAREIENAEGKLAKSRLYGEMARLCRERLKDNPRAEESAKKAVELDPTAVDGLFVLGELAFEGLRYTEAARYLESLAARTEILDRQDALLILSHYMTSLVKSGLEAKAVSGLDFMVEFAPDDQKNLLCASEIAAEHASAEQSYKLNEQYLEKFGDILHGHEKSIALYRLGEAARKLEKLDQAIQLLEEATDLDPSSSLPLRSLTMVYESKQDWEEVIRIKNRHLDIVSGNERSELLVEIGDIIAQKIGDRTRAAKTFVAALEDRPDDRKLLTKLMQLYSEEKDWAKLIEIVMRLADFVDDGKQKAKYIHTAASITHKQLHDLDAAIGYYNQVLELDPSLHKALTEVIELRREKGEWSEVEKLLLKQLQAAEQEKDKDKLIRTHDALGELYHRQLGKVPQAIDSFEVAQGLDPDNRERNETLAEMYSSEPELYLDKAVASQRMILRRNPHKPEAYKLLRRMYTEVKRADAAWCLCQALYVLNLAEPDEERFFKRMRAENAIAAQTSVTEEDWALRLRHEEADPMVTSIFALIESAVLDARSQTLEAMGYDPRYAIDLSMHPYPLSQTIYYAAGILGMTPPMTFQNPHDPGGLSFLHARTPAIVLGTSAMAQDIPTQAAAFLAARHLTYYRPGFYVRHLIPTGTGLKSWLFAAIKLIISQFPVSKDMEASVAENLDTLKSAIQGQTRDHLASVVTKLIQSGGSLDLKKWVSAVDLTADRTGFMVCHDLEIATELLKASDDGQGMPFRERMKELILFSVSEPYFSMRQRLGVAIDS